MQIGPKRVVELSSFCQPLPVSLSEVQPVFKKSMEKGGEDFSKAVSLLFYFTFTQYRQ